MILIKIVREAAPVEGTGNPNPSKPTHRRESLAVLLWAVGVRLAVTFVV